MENEIIVRPLPRAPIDDQDFEICEHKGIGHPDTITDGVCESASRALSLAYRARVGRILHHNVDKGLLVGGSSAPRFGGGEITKAAKLIICGRAADLPGEDVCETAIAGARRYLEQHIRCFPRLFEVDAQIRQGSAHLEAVMAGAGRAALANDTSFGVGFAPYSRLEKLVLGLSGILSRRTSGALFPLRATTSRSWPSAPPVRARLSSRSRSP